jgi:O-antigen/teichoic acid export membrane protein
VFAASSFYPAHRALPWVALGWALYGLFLVFVVMAGRADVTSRNFPAALAGLVANVVLLVVLVPPLGIAGAGLALCGAYLVILAFMYTFTRGLFAVRFERRRLAQLVLVIGGMTAAADVVVATSGAVALVLRAAIVLAIPLVLVASGFLHPEEWTRLRALVRRGRPRSAPAG